MGCCSSRQAADGATANNGDGTSATPAARITSPAVYRPNSINATDSARNIITASQTSPSRASSPASVSQVSHPPVAPAAPRPHPQPRSTTKSLTATGPPNPPLRPLDPNRTCKLPDPLSIPTSTSSQNPTSTPWTRSKLLKERRDWWDTRDTGSREIWDAYRVMIEHLQAGEVDEATTLLDACGCTCPSGKLWHAVYDERGVEYGIVGGNGNVRGRGREYEWVVFEPRGLVEEDLKTKDRAGERDSGIDTGSGMGMDIGKGKQRAEENEEEVLNVKCRLSSTGRDHVVKYRKGENIGVIMEALSRVTGLEPKRHRISYLGRLYSANEHLPTEGERAWKDYNVLSVLVVEGQ